MFQKVIIIGHLGRDPEMRFTGDGKPVTSFSVATNKTYTKADGQRVKTTTWFKVSVFGKMAEATNNYLRQGSKVYVEGELSSDPATGGPKTFTRQDGSFGTSFEMIASTVKFLDSKDESPGTNGEDVPTDQIPF